MSKKTTRKALLGSVLALVLCVAMLVGSTFAWFTDSVQTGPNTIQSGNLDVELQYSKDGENWSDVKYDTKVFTEDALYEPGYTEVVYLRVKNAGSLHLQYAITADIYNEKTGINVFGNEFKLSDYLTYGIVNADEFDQLKGNRDFAASVATNVLSSVEEIDLSGVLEDLGYGNGWDQLIGAVSTERSLEPGESRDIALVLTMPTTVDNNANHNGEKVPSVDIGIDLLAKQYTHESDSFNNQYDADATYPSGGTAMWSAGIVALEVRVRNEAGAKVGSVVVDTDSIANTDLPIEVIYDDSDYNGNIIVETGYETHVVDIKVLNLKDNNDVPVKATIRLPAGLDPKTVTLYHYDVKIESTYNPNTGYVTFESTSFSPFTVVYDAESVYVPTPPAPEDLPKATVVNSTEYENVALPWGSYGQWSPTEGLDSQLEAAYTFSCEETAEEAEANPYANWYCDFYVKLDKELGENEIFLGGNYGSFGWVGFHNGDMTLEANTEIPLLGSVTTNPWTYAEVAEYVGTFICGVGDVDDALSGATFSVMLRLSNPENEKEFYDVATINYTFE